MVSESTCWHTCMSWGMCHTHPLHLVFTQFIERQIMEVHAIYVTRQHPCQHLHRFLHPQSLISMFLFVLSLTRWHMPPSLTSAEAWPNAYPQGRDKCSVARHHQVCLTVCVMCRCCMTSFSRNWLRQPACLQPGQSPPERDRCVQGLKREWARESERPCATIFYLLGFISTVTVMANTHCMTDGLALACLVP